jgi:glutathione synthase
VVTFIVTNPHTEKMPEILRLKTIITTDVTEIKDLNEKNKKKIILIPLQGSVGTNVFLADKNNQQNLNQMPGWIYYCAGIFAEAC